LVFTTTKKFPEGEGPTEKIPKIALLSQSTSIFVSYIKNRGGTDPLPPAADLHVHSFPA